MNHAEKDPSQSSSTNNQAAILASWLTAVADFYSLHTQLSDCLVRNSGLPVASAGATRWIGQCPVSHIETLLATMQTELETMLNDTDQFEKLPTQDGYEHLTTHVAHISQFNQQAERLLRLTSLPTV